MILGMSLSTFTTVHVIISVVGIVSGFFAVYGMLNGRRLDWCTTLFLVTTVLTSVTGFFFPFHGITPAIIFGIISLVVLAIALAALYVYRLAGAVALDLHRDRVARPLPQQLRGGGAGLPEDSIAARLRSDAVRASVRRRARCS